jgi:hypothetical protein
MKISFSHINEQGFDCAIFDADASTDTDSARRALLSDLVLEVRRQGLRVDKAVLAYAPYGNPTFFGDKDLAQFLVSLMENGGSFPWTVVVLDACQE